MKYTLKGAIDAVQTNRRTTKAFQAQTYVEEECEAGERVEKVHALLSSLLPE